MGAEEHALVRALMHHNEEMRVIAVGDDDQNIYEFRGSDAGYMFRLTQEPGSRFVEMTENYRSARHVVNFANEFAKNIRKRMKRMPIISMRKENGWVGVTYHQSEPVCINHSLKNCFINGEAVPHVYSPRQMKKQLLSWLFYRKGYP